MKNQYLPEILTQGDPESVCVIDIQEGRTLTYSELYTASSKFAGYLRGLGVKRGDRVGILLPNGWRFAVSLYAVLMCEGLAVPIDYRSSDREVGFYLQNSGAGFVVCSPERSIGIYGGIRVIVFSEELYMAHDGLAEVGGVLDVVEDALIFYTGGTTGTPKGVVLTHKNIFTVLRGLTEAWELTRGGEVFAQVLPMTHSGGLNCSFNTALYSGGKCVVMKRFDPKVLLRVIEDYRVSVLVGVPTIYGELVRELASSNWDVSSLRVCFSSGAPISEKVAREFQRLTGIVLNVGWGLTEASPQLTVAPLGVFKPNYVGVPLSGVEVGAFDGDTRLPLGAVGELGVRGEQIMKRYWNNDEETRKVFNTSGYLLTGDIGYVDSDGVYLLGRRKNVINTGGYKVWPHEVEQAIMENPHVREVAVVGVDDEKYGEVVKAFVVSDGQISVEELRDFCKKLLAGYKVPRVFEFRSELPKSSVGKILHRVLKEESQKRY
ncbi:MAG: AMP-binding protein [Thermoprotei archaeon]